MICSSLSLTLVLLSHISTLLYSSVTDQEKRASSRGEGGLVRRYSSFNLLETRDNDHIIEVARKFLSTACPELLTIFDNHYDEGSSRDRLVKIGRNINATLRYSEEDINREENCAGKSAFVLFLSCDFSVFNMKCRQVDYFT